MTDQAKLDAANSYFARAKIGKGVDLEALKHIEVALKDMETRASKAMIIAGKARAKRRSARTPPSIFTSRPKAYRR